MPQSKLPAHRQRWLAAACLVGLFGASAAEPCAPLQVLEAQDYRIGKGDADRDFYTVHWRDPGVRGSRWVNDLAFSDSNDGHGWRVELERPFYAFDTRWSFSTALQQDQSVEPVYRLGERIAGYARQTEFGEIKYGWSDGLTSTRCSSW